MLLGVILVISGILIALYPPLLSLIVAALFIFIGAMVLMMSYRYKKTARRFEDPFLDFFMKM